MLREDYHRAAECWSRALDLGLDLELNHELDEGEAWDSMMTSFFFARRRERMSQLLRHPAADSEQLRMKWLGLRSLLDDDLATAGDYLTAFAAAGGTFDACWLLELAKLAKGRSGAFDMANLPADSPTIEGSLTCLLTAALEDRAIVVSHRRNALWATALNQMLMYFPVSMSAPLITQLHALFPADRFIANQAKFLALFPSEVKTTFQDDPNAPMVVVDRGSPVACLIFGGMANAIGMRFSMFDLLLERLGLSAVYLRDHSQRLFTSGVVGMGLGVAGTAAAVHRQLKAIGADSVVCIGSSGGSFAAGLYAPSFDTRQVLMLAGPTSLDYAHQERHGLLPYLGLIGLDAPQYCADLKSLWRTSGADLDVHYFHGDVNPRDLGHARNIEPVATVHRLANHPGHVPAAALIKSGRFEKILRRHAPRRPHKRNGHMGSRASSLKHQS